jgi:oligosaccharyltransferase complex subunit alpha (ribophorin I)
VNNKGRGEIEYGPFVDIDPYQYKDFKVHFANQNYALVAKNYAKTVKVAYYRPLLHFQEDYEVHNEGAKYYITNLWLKGHFSMIDHKMRTHRNIPGGVTVFDSIIPIDSTEIFFKDLIGNVSTSTIVDSKKKKHLELHPRYPVYGGWRYSWFHGYTTPQEAFLKSLGGEKLEISVSMTPTVKGLLCEKAKLTVILPEGARQIRIDNPYDGKQSVVIKHLYFDTIGRPTVIIERENLVDEMGKPIKVLFD